MRTKTVTTENFLNAEKKLIKDNFIIENLITEKWSRQAIRNVCNQKRFFFGTILLNEVKNSNNGITKTAVHEVYEFDIFLLVEHKPNS